MCRSLADGGRRCPYADLHRRRPRANAAARAQVSRYSRRLAEIQRGGSPELRAAVRTQLAATDPTDPSVVQRLRADRLRARRTGDQAAVDTLTAQLAAAQLVLAERRLEDSNAASLPDVEPEAVVGERWEERAARLGQPDPAHAIPNLQPPVYTEPAPRTDEEIETHVIAVAHSFQRWPTEYVNLANVRASLHPDLDRATVDAAMQRINRRRGATFAPDDIGESITPAEHDSALHIGGTDSHLIYLDTKDVAFLKGRQLPAPTIQRTDQNRSDEEGGPRPPQAESPSGDAQEGSRRGTTRVTKKPERGPISGQLTDKPLWKNHWGEFQPDARVAYHDDGVIGSAVKSMGQDQRMLVDGEPLANVLGALATDVAAQRRSPQDGLDAMKQLRDRLPASSRARAAVVNAIDRIDAPQRPAPSLPEGTPEPLRRLVHNLNDVPIVRREPGRELDPLIGVITDYVVNKRHPREFLFELDRIGRKRHESDGDIGYHQIRDAVAATRKEMHTHIREQQQARHQQQ